MNLTRRSFLKAGALAAAGLAAPALPAAAQDAPAPSPVFRGAVRPTAWGPVQGRQTGASLVWYGVPYGLSLIHI